MKPKPPPRGVGRVCEERWFGASMTAQRKSPRRVRAQAAAETATVTAPISSSSVVGLVTFGSRGRDGLYYCYLHSHEALAQC